MTPVEMPKANENMTEATLDRWLVKEGDRVSREQPLCEIITEKAKFEFPAPADGQVLKLLAAEKTVLPVGYVFCVLGASGEAVPDDIAERNAALVKAHHGMVTATGNVPPASGQSPLPLREGLGGGVRATPAARRLAKEHKVQLAEVASALKLTGPVTEKDIKAYLETGGKP
jgi:pyruvate/2-oxoglutarate dehydrogenase complex dihydrolipoamide acyltransferase (E2) component